VLERNRVLARLLGEACADLADHPRVGEVRQCGMILAIEMARDRATRTPYPWQQRRGRTVYRHALENGVLLRPLGDVVYLMPPYVITPEQIERIAAVARAGIDLATG
jgi:adenosylmethionine-8-amino-7-oxononanoate aminotransferase